jgi:hypothetical protein
MQRFVDGWYNQAWGCDSEMTMRLLVKMLFFAAIGFSFSGAARAQATPDSVNLTGLWYDETQAGHGVNIVHQGNILFVAWYVYDRNSKPVWLVAAATRQTDGRYIGALNSFLGIPFNLIEGAQASTATQPRGEARLLLRADGRLDFSYSVDGVAQTRVFEKATFAAVPPSCSFTTETLAGASNFTDVWWRPSESGWGVSMVHQGDLIFIAWYTYGPDGRPMWVNGLATRRADGSFQGDLNRPQSGVPFDLITGPATSFPVPTVGTFVLRFSDGENASFSYTLDGFARTRFIERLRFVPAGVPRSVCSTPSVELSASALARRPFEPLTLTLPIGYGVPERWHMEWLLDDGFVFPASPLHDGRDFQLLAPPVFDAASGLPRTGRGRVRLLDERRNVVAISPPIELSRMESLAVAPGAVTAIYLERLIEAHLHANEFLAILHETQPALVSSVQIGTPAMQGGLAPYERLLASVQSFEGAPTVIFDDGSGRIWRIDTETLRTMDALIYGLFMTGRSGTSIGEKSEEDLLSEFRSVIQQELPRDLRDLSLRARAGASIAVAVASFAVGAASAPAAATLGAVAFAATTFVPAAVSFALEGGSRAVLDESFGIFELEQTLGILVDGYTDFALGAAAETASELVPSGEPILQLLEHAQNLATLVEGGGSGPGLYDRILSSLPSIRSQIETGLQALRGDEPPAGMGVLYISQVQPIGSTAQDQSAFEIHGFTVNAQVRVTSSCPSPGSPATLVYQSLVRWPLGPTLEANPENFPAFAWDNGGYTLPQPVSYPCDSTGRRSGMALLTGYRSESVSDAPIGPFFGGGWDGYIGRASLDVTVLHGPPIIQRVPTATVTGTFELKSEYESGVCPGTGLPIRYSLEVPQTTVSRQLVRSVTRVPMTEAMAEQTINGILRDGFGPLGCTFIPVDLEPVRP